MTLILSVIFFVLALCLLGRMFHSRDIIDVQLGVTGAFSIGYYCLPAWFMAASLAGPDASALMSVEAISLVFLLTVVFGVSVGRGLMVSVPGLRSPRMDRVTAIHPLLVSIVAFGVFVYYYATASITSYSADDFNSYFDSGSSFNSILTVLAHLSMAWIAYSLVVAAKTRSRGQAIVSGLFLLAVVAMLVFVGQRLAFLTPIIMLLCFAGLVGKRKWAPRMLVLSIVALGLISPLAVAIRQAQGQAGASSVVQSFSYGSSPSAAIFQSVLDRGDLLSVSAAMKPYIESEGLMGPGYYASVLLNPIPSAVYPGQKPYLLSSNGTASGELSVLAWNRLHGGGPGSLSAFGGIVAYRELRWPGVVINGFATGLLFVLVMKIFAGGGVVGRLMFANLFVDFAVAKVPPSFWEALASIMPLLPFLLIVLFLEKWWPTGLASATVASASR